MTDIVERLRQCIGLIDVPHDDPWGWEMCKEAADEIERLRDENRKLREKQEALRSMTGCVFPDCIKRAENERLYRALHCVVPGDRRAMTQYSRRQ